MLDVLTEFVELVADGAPLLVGHSYGAQLVRGLLQHHPDRYRGALMLSPGGTEAPEESGRVPAPAALRHPQQVDHGADAAFSVLSGWSEGSTETRSGRRVRAPSTGSTPSGTGRWGDHGIGRRPGKIVPAEGSRRSALTYL